MADGSSNITIDDISKLNVTDLKKELTVRGQDTQGNKGQLQARLRCYLQQQGLNMNQTANDENISEESIVTKSEFKKEMDKIWSKLNSLTSQEVESPLQRIEELLRENSLLREENKKLKSKLNLSDVDGLQIPEDTYINSPFVHNGNSPFVHHGNSPYNRYANSSATSNRNNHNIHRENKTANSAGILLVGDSMIKNIDPKKLSRKRVYKHTFPGKTAQEIAEEVNNLNTVQEQPSHIIICAGTNNVPTDTPDECASNIKKLADTLQSKYPTSKIGISTVMHRSDIDVSDKITDINDKLTDLTNNEFTLINNSTIDNSCLNHSKLHLNAKGSAILATRFIKFLNPSKLRSNHGNHRQPQDFPSALQQLLSLLQPHPQPHNQQWRNQSHYRR